MKYVTDHIKYFQIGGNPQLSQQSIPQPQMIQQQDLNNQQSQSGDNETMELLQAYFSMNQMTQEQIQQFMQEFQQLKPEEQQQVVQHIQEQVQASGQNPQEQQGEPTEQQPSGQPMEQPQMATGGIMINPAHKGEFTAKAQRAGMGVQEYAHYVMSHSNDLDLRKQANFAINFGGKHQVGGQFDYNRKPQEWFDIPQNITDRFSYVDAPKNTFTDFSNANMNFTGDSPRYLYDLHQDKYLLRNNVGQYRLADQDRIPMLQNAPKRQVGGMGSSMSLEMSNPILPLQYDSVHTGGYNQELDKYGFNNKKTNRQFQVGTEYTTPSLDSSLEGYNGVLPLPSNQTMSALPPTQQWQIPMLAPVQSNVELPLVSHGDVAKYAPPVSVSQVNKAASKSISQLTNKDKQVLSVGHSDAQALQAYLDANGGKTMSKRKNGDYDGIVGTNTINAMKQVYTKETGKAAPSANELSKYFSTKVQGSGIKITPNDIKANLTPAYKDSRTNTKGELPEVTVTANRVTTPTGASTSSNTIGSQRVWTATDNNSQSSQSTKSSSNVVNPKQDTPYNIKPIVRESTRINSPIQQNNSRVSDRYQDLGDGYVYDPITTDFMFRGNVSGRYMKIKNPETLRYLTKKIK